MKRLHHVRARRAATAVMVVVFLPVLIGFAALTVDVGTLYNTRIDLQNAADAAALAAAHTYTTPAGMHMRIGMWSNFSDVQADAIVDARHVTDSSPLFGNVQVKIADSDVTLGYIDINSSSSGLVTSTPPSNYNGVHVITRRSVDSPNGPASLFFAGVFGKHYANVSASAVAALNDHFSGLQTSESESHLLIWPFTMHIADYNAQLVSGGDTYGYDDDSQAVVENPDGTREVILYPGDQAPGNYGLINVGSPSLSADELSEQIESGITTADFETTFGTSDLGFFDESGAPTPFLIPGNPGLKAKLEEAIQLRNGDFVGFFLHDLVQGTGSNTKYQVVSMRFGRVMGVALQVGAKKRGLWIQPMTYDGPGVRVNLAAPSSMGAAGTVMLVR